MVNPHKDRNNVLHQAREPEHRDDPANEAGRPPYPGEIIGRKEAPFKVTGLDALAPLFANIRFPATKEEVLAALGQVQIPIDKWRLAQAGEILANLAPESFRSSEELQAAFNRTFHERAQGETRGSHHWQRDDVHGSRVR
ncbi:MAG TPA: hypothetical protein VFH78_01925 [Candidatus Thermoplasmatota archaeon]|nr:hypothetical protein [Candidatus Thermoplasmatota archaeon]